MLSKAMAFLAANPIVLVVAAVVALIAILVHLWKTNEDFRNAIINAWNKIVEVIKGVVEKIKTFFTETIPDAAKALVDWFKELPDKIKQIGKDLITGLWNGIKEKIDWLKSKVTGVVDTIKGWFTGSKGFDVHFPVQMGRDAWRERFCWNCKRIDRQCGSDIAGHEQSCISGAEWTYQHGYTTEAG